MNWLCQWWGAERGGCSFFTCSYTLLAHWFLLTWQRIVFWRTNWCQGVDRNGVSGAQWERAHVLLTSQKMFKQTKWSLKRRHKKLFLHNLCSGKPGPGRSEDQQDEDGSSAALSLCVVFDYSSVRVGVNLPLCEIKQVFSSREEQILLFVWNRLETRGVWGGKKKSQFIQRHLKVESTLNSE